MNNFIQIINGYGSTDAQRAKNLGISVRTLYRYKAGKRPSLKVVLDHPRLAIALAKDAKK